MSRLCERPGCSDAAAVAYGMRTQDLVFWLDVLDEGAEPPSGVLCRRHGDGMVVPRGWTLDDLRDPDLHLFRPPAADTSNAQRRPRRRTAASSEPSGQLALDGVEPSPEPSPAATAPPAPTEEQAERQPVPVGDEAGDSEWQPTFDADDDLGGLLAARSPLLSRAFRGTDRPA